MSKPDLKGSGPREESVIFADLARLCATPGYAHVLAFLCFRDDFVHVGPELDPEAVAALRGSSRLIRTEMSTLIGLMVKGEIDLSLPDVPTREQQTVETDALLHELHDSMTASMAEAVFGSDTPAPFTRGRVLREPIFYGPESAYIFQYRDFSEAKYRRDEQWLRSKVGFSASDARAVASALFKLRNAKVQKALDALDPEDPSEWSLLPGFTFSPSEVVSASGLSDSVVDAVLQAFALPEGETNEEFRSLGDFNVTNARPLIPLKTGEYLLYQAYTFAEALYESPFFWMLSDSSYKDTAFINRGVFTEELCAERLRAVFGAARVHTNVHIVDSKGNDAAEIDVLVCFADRAIVVQAKSKRMTIEARKGNDQRINEDFGRSVRDAFEQGQVSARHLRDRSYRLRDSHGDDLDLPRDYREIYVLCVVCDHYPALALQAREFLRGIPVDAGVSSLVMDVFLLDVMAEMLSSPLRFLSYLSLRTEYGNRFHATHELVVLGYHLARNLWMEDKMNLVSLDDDISSDLDAAMYVRREGHPGRDTPEGILTRFRDTTIGRVLEDIETLEAPGVISLGFLLLTLSEDTLLKVSNGIDDLVKRCSEDGKPHDLSIGVGASGLTIHCNTLPDHAAMKVLRDHCTRRKHVGKTDQWLGLCLDADTGSVRLGCELEFPWEESAEMEEQVKRSVRSRTAKLTGGKKVGRNEPCPCGSGRKFKKCCGGATE